jgi:hypothetical protein
MSNKLIRYIITNLDNYEVLKVSSKTKQSLKAGYLVEENSRIGLILKRKGIFVNIIHIPLLLRI